MSRMLFVILIFGMPVTGFAKSEVQYPGLHTSTRILLPIDSDQNTNVLVHGKQAKQEPITAPLVSIEQISVPGKKHKILKLKLSTGSTEQSD